MRICYFAAPDSVHTLRWLRYMEAKGHDLEIVTLDPRQMDWPKSWRIHTLPPDFPGQPPQTVWRLANITRGHNWVPAGLWLLGALKLRRFIKKLAPDLIDVHYIDDLPISALLSGFHPIVATPWGTDLLIRPKRYTPPQRWLFQRALASADLLTCNSETLRQAAIGFGVKSEKIQLRQWGVDLKEFQPGLNTAGLRDKWGIKPTSLVLLSPRTLQKPLYCIDGVLRAFQRVLERYPDAVLLQLGSSSYPEALAKLKELSRQLGIASKVRWLDFVPEHELPLVFNLAKLTVSLSTSDSLPTSLLEAMACGSVPVFSDVGSINEWIDSGENGMLVEPGSADSLTAAILRTLDQPATWWDHAQSQNREIIRIRANRAHELEAVVQDYSMLVNRYQRRNASRTANADGRIVI